MQEVPLGAIDLFHLVQDRHLRALGQPGNHCAFVAELGGRVHLADVASRLEIAKEVFEPLSYQLVRRLGRGPAWRVGAPRHGALSIHRTHSSVLGAAAKLLEQRVGPDAPWRLDLVRGPERDAIVFRWFHPLADSRGVERFLGWLGGDDREPPKGPLFATSDRLIQKLSREERVALARRYAQHSLGLAKERVVSAATGGPFRVGRAVTERIHLSEASTARFDARAKELARLNETAVMATMTAQAVHALLSSRGQHAEHHLLPVPLSLDPKGAIGRMFGNNLAMMLVSLRTAELADEQRVVDGLVEQQRAVVRDKLDRAMIAALDVSRPLPWWAIWWVMTRPFRGEVASAIFSNPGTIALDRMFGLDVVDAYPLPAVVSPPGLQVIFSRHRGRLSAMVSAFDGLVSAVERDQLVRALERKLSGEPASPAAKDDNRPVARHTNHDGHLEDEAERRG